MVQGLGRTSTNVSRVLAGTATFRHAEQLPVRPSESRLTLMSFIRQIRQDLGT